MERGFGEGGGTEGGVKGVKAYRVPSLHKHNAGPGELAHEALARGHAGDDASRGDALEDVLCAPGHEVAVVDDVLFAVGELFLLDPALKLGERKAKGSKNKGIEEEGREDGSRGKGERGETHRLLYNRPKARDPKQTHPTHLVHEKPLAREHGLGQPLPLIVPDDSLRGDEVGVLADGPRGAAVEADGGDVAEHGGREEDLAWPRVVGGAEAAHYELLH